MDSESGSEYEPMSPTREDSPSISGTPPQKSKPNGITKTPHDEMIARIPLLTPDAGPAVSLQNVVCTVNLGCNLDLTKINIRTRNSEYNPRRFCGLIMRLREPRSTALIFGSGKIVVTGIRHEQNAVLACRKFARILQKVGFPVRFTQFKIHNMVATFDLRSPIKLEHLNQVHGQFSSYEPELFPALIYRMIKPRIVLLVFVNGKVVITGAKCREDIQEGMDNMLPILRSFRKT